MERNQSIISNEENNYWQSKLHALRFSCGCKTGMTTLFLTLLGSLYYFQVAAEPFYSSGRKTLYILLLSFSGAIIGKIIGIFWARMKYHKLRKLLLKRGISIYSKPIDE